MYTTFLTMNDDMWSNAAGAKPGYYLTLARSDPTIRWCFSSAQVEAT